MNRDEMREKLLALRERETVTVKTAYNVGAVPGAAWFDPPNMGAPVRDPSPPGPLAVGEEMADGRWRFPLRRGVLGDFETGPMPFASSYEDVEVDSQGRMWAIVRKL